MEGYFRLMETPWWPETSYAVRNSTEKQHKTGTGCLALLPSLDALTKVHFANQDLGTRSYIRNSAIGVPLDELYQPPSLPK